VNSVRAIDAGWNPLGRQKHRTKARTECNSLLPPFHTPSPCIPGSDASNAVTHRLRAQELPKQLPTRCPEGEDDHSRTRHFVEEIVGPKLMLCDTRVNQISHSIMRSAKRQHNRRSVCQRRAANNGTCERCGRAGGRSNFSAYWLHFPYFWSCGWGPVPRTWNIDSDWEQKCEKEVVHCLQFIQMGVFERVQFLVISYMSLPWWKSSTPKSTGSTGM